MRVPPSGAVDGACTAFALRRAGEGRPRSGPPSRWPLQPRAEPGEARAGAYLQVQDGAVTPPLFSSGRWARTSRPRPAPSPAPFPAQREGTAHHPRLGASWPAAKWAAPRTSSIHPVRPEFCIFVPETGVTMSERREGGIHPHRPTPARKKGRRQGLLARQWPWVEGGWPCRCHMLSGPGESPGTCLLGCPGSSLPSWASFSETVGIPRPREGTSLQRATWRARQSASGRQSASLADTRPSLEEIGCVWPGTEADKSPDPMHSPLLVLLLSTCCTQRTHRRH